MKSVTMSNFETKMFKKKSFRSFEEEKQQHQQTVTEAAVDRAVHALLDLKFSPSRAGRLPVLLDQVELEYSSCCIQSSASPSSSSDSGGDICLAALDFAQLSSPVPSVNHCSSLPTSPFVDMNLLLQCNRCLAPVVSLVTGMPCSCYDACPQWVHYDCNAEFASEMSFHAVSPLTSSDNDNISSSDDTEEQHRTKRYKQEILSPEVTLVVERQCWTASLDDDLTCNVHMLHPSYCAWDETQVALKDSINRAILLLQEAVLYQNTCPYFLLLNSTNTAGDQVCSAFKLLAVKDSAAALCTDYDETSDLNPLVCLQCVYTSHQGFLVDIAEGGRQDIVMCPQRLDEFCTDTLPVLLERNYGLVSDQHNCSMFDSRCSSEDWELLRLQVGRWNF